MHCFRFPRVAVLTGSMLGALACGTAAEETVERTPPQTGPVVVFGGAMGQVEGPLLKPESCGPKCGVCVAGCDDAGGASPPALMSGPVSRWRVYRAGRYVEGDVSLIYCDDKGCIGQAGGSGSPSK